MFAFDPSLLPSLRTRKALLVLDLQNDFVAADGALPVREPPGYVQRAIEVANAFRQSGSGDVIWVCSEFQEHRALFNEQILTSDLPLPSASIRGRRAGLRIGRGEADPEAFLSLAGASESLQDDNEDEDGNPRGPKPECVRPGKNGSALADDVAAAVVSGRDSVLTKTDYSAFQSGQLLKLLRTRFATELYICGALTNVSIHATALDAGSHGLATTIIEDCCGHRSSVRHNNAVQNLVQLTGCETMSAQDLISSLAATSAPVVTNAPPPATLPIREKRSPPSAGPVRTGGGGGGHQKPSSPRSSPRGKFVRDTAVRITEPSPVAALKGDPKTLSDASPAAAGPKAPQPQTSQQPLQPMVGSKARGDGSLDSESSSASTASVESSSRPKRVSPSSTKAGRQQDDDRLLKTADESSSANSANTYKAEEHTQRPTTSTKGANDKLRGKSHADTQTTIETPGVPLGTPSSDPACKEHKCESPKSGSKSLEKEVSSSNGSGLPESDSSAEDMQSAKMSKSRTPSEPLCEGDTTIIHNALSEKLENGLFERLKDEVQWLRMSHQGGEVPRLVCVQGEVDVEGNMPVYRHPSDESPPLVPFTPAVLQIKAEVEEVLGHTLNHVLIQFYRSGNDYISEHSDKTLDITLGSFIANVSLGAERTMVLRTKRTDKDPSLKSELPAASDETRQAGSAKRQTVRARLPHNSLCRMGLKTNERWLHAIRQDKRHDRDKTDEEIAYSGGRISLTFRRIGTFLDREASVIWGQGATSKTRDGAGRVLNGIGEEAIRMLKAFGTENHSSTFDWDTVYGKGFDVLHMSSSPRFFSSPDSVVNMRIQLMLAAFGIAYAKGSMGAASGSEDVKNADTESGAPAPGQIPVKFVDNDPGRAVVQGDAAIMLYLDSVYRPKKEAAAPRTELASGFTFFQQALSLRERWRAVAPKEEAAREGDEKPEVEGDAAPESPSKKAARALGPLARDLAVYEAHLCDTDAAHADKDRSDCFIAGGVSASLADYALWPVLHDMACTYGGPAVFVGALQQHKLGRVASYYESFGRSKLVQGVLGGDATKRGGTSP